MSDSDSEPDAALHKERTTVMFMDVVESMQMIAQDELGGIQRIRSFLAHVANEVIPAYQGRVAESRGDGLLLRFAHSGDVVACAAALHRAARASGLAQPSAPRLRLRIGVHVADIYADASALYGAGVNLAARIAAAGEPDDTLLSATARDELNAEIDGTLQDLGPCHLKHVDAPLRLFRHRVELPTLPQELDAAITARMKLRPTILVLPMETIVSSAPAVVDEGNGPKPPMARSHGSLGQLLCDQVTRQLSRSTMLHVISALSANALRGRRVDLASLYRVTRCDYILQGRLQGDADHGEATNRIVLDVDLWRAGSDAPVWSQRLQGTALDLLSPHSDLLGRLVDGVGTCILRVAQRTADAAQMLPNLASHTLYLNAVDLLHRFDVAQFQRAGDMLMALSERVPRHPDPPAWLARWHVFKVVQGWSVDHRRDADQALSYSERALDRDPQSALALTMAGSVHAGVRRDPVVAQDYYAKALQYNPNESLAWLMSGVAQGFMTAREPALAASETALGLAPMDPIRPYFDALAATASLRAGEYERCVALAARSIEANAAHGSAYRAKAIAEVLLGRHEQARVTVRGLLGVEPHFTLNTYLARVPAQDEQSRLFADALEQAGLPSH